MLALIDHDLVVFRCAASAENDDFGIAVHRAEGLLDELLTKHKSHNRIQWLINDIEELKQDISEQFNNVEKQNLDDWISGLEKE